jgi:hypothetical protein
MSALPPEGGRREPVSAPIKLSLWAKISEVETRGKNLPEGTNFCTRRLLDEPLNGGKFAGFFFNN